MNVEFLLYCRSGYEADLLAEIDHKLSLAAMFGYAQFKKDCGFLRYTLTPQSNQQATIKTQKQYHMMPSLKELIFARQKSLVVAELSFNNLHDRVTELIERVSQIIQQNGLDFKKFGDIRVEYPDTEDGKQMAKFTKKFTVPLRSGLRKAKYLSKIEDSQLPYLHVFFEQGDACLLSISFADDRSEQLLGVKRLKFPAESPSRSTLKLEEAITLFCTAQQQNKLFQAGMTAVDLGACPGGWTYQLVRRGLHVEAVDNGAMDDKLMQSGLVTYIPADGFAYTPKDKHVDWLVCDMIEKPDRVAKLIMAWLNKRLASAAIFNLKLPMKRRYATLAPIIEAFEQELNDNEESVYMQAKHLYHNRDEVTFMIIKNSQMQDEFKH